MKTILIVDDELAILGTLADVLEEQGYRCVTAENGREGLERMAEAPPDLVITDVMMPVLDGRDLVRAMRKDPALQGVRVIMMSAARGLLGSETIGHDAFLAKPFALEEVLEAVARLLHRFEPR